MTATSLARPEPRTERIETGRKAQTQVIRKHRPKAFHFDEIEPGVWLTPSDTHKGISYRLRENGEIVTHCNCPGWETAKKRGRKCKHAKRLAALLDLPGCEEIVTNDTEEDSVPARPVCAKHGLFDPFNVDHEIFGYPSCPAHTTECDRWAALTTHRALPETARQAA